VAPWLVVVVVVVVDEEGGLLSVCFAPSWPRVILPYSLAAHIFTRSPESPPPNARSQNSSPLFNPHTNW
jgi:hypothetical protein